MKSIFSVASEECWSQWPWLIAGKGPSFQNLMDSGWHGPAFVLNHVVESLRRQQITYTPTQTVAHLIDLEVLSDIPDAYLSRACQYVAMPWVPNVGMHRGHKSLRELMDEMPVLKALEPKILYYNRSNSHIKIEGGGSVDVRFFSAEAAFDILGQAGVKRITTCGIDGGKNHHREFSDQALVNGRQSFDEQFGRIVEMQRKYGFTTEALCTLSQSTTSKPSGRQSRSPTSSLTGS